MLFKRKEKIADLIVSHIENAAKCIKTAGRSVDSHIDDNQTEATDLALMADALALDADHKMEIILSRLCKGAVLAPIRENLYLLSSSFNQLANAAASCGLFFLDRRPQIPPPFRIIFHGFAETAFGGYPELQSSALDCLKGAWHPDKACELVSKFEKIRKQFKTHHREMNALILENGVDALEQTRLDICQTRIADVFERMTMTAETITQINLRIGN